MYLSFVIWINCKNTLETFYSLIKLRLISANKQRDKIYSKNNSSFLERHNLSNNKMASKIESAATSLISNAVKTFKLSDVTKHKKIPYKNLYEISS